ncbi:hypothetical protein V493_00668 [Pseudogymnoascus sp. VKM F-4281 (FW-2241)]|nr:hypothetical protein V493_00668 [Pseudogymnoascus sp. VKM F-4281 (FW-2241)]
MAEVFSTQMDLVEMRLERNESPKYLMAKALFVCHELRRCAAVYLSTNSSEHIIPLQNNVLNITHGKFPGSAFSKTSQKGLFLASYALLIAGEKEKTEDLGRILGPSDTGAIINKQIAPLKPQPDPVKIAAAHYGIHILGSLSPGAAPVLDGPAF